MQRLRRLLCLWGNAEYGRLGLGDGSGGKMLPHICETVKNPESVACGAAHTVVLTDSGEVWSFGLNTDGQLGQSSAKEAIWVPVRVEIPEPVKKIAAGHLHTLCLTRSGAVWAFGSNTYGQLGIGHKIFPKTTPSPVKLKDFKGVDICCGALHSLGLSASGDVYSWGSNQQGQLGHPSKLFDSPKSFEPRLIRELRGVTVQCLAAGHVCSGVVDEDGRIYTWGSNAFWQLGYPSISHTLTRPFQISGLAHGHHLIMGGRHTMCVMENGSVFVWGTNENGCLGLGPKAEASTPSITLTDTLTGKVSISEGAPGGNALIETVIPSPTVLEDTRLTQGSLGWKHSGGVTSDGVLWMWGWGGSVGETTYFLENHEGPGGQLGHGTDFDAWTPTCISPPSLPPETIAKFRCVSCGLNHTAAVIDVHEISSSS